MIPVVVLWILAGANLAMMAALQISSARLRKAFEAARVAIDQARMAHIAAAEAHIVALRSIVVSTIDNGEDRPAH